MRKHSTADRLQQLMSEKSLKQVDIIELSKHFQDKLDVKLGKSALSQYVNGIQTPDQKKLALLALTLDVSEAWLMVYDVPKERTYYTNEETPTLSCYTSSDLRKMAENAKTFDGKPLDKEDITAIQNLIEIYLRGR